MNKQWLGSPLNKLFLRVYSKCSQYEIIQASSSTLSSFNLGTLFKFMVHEYARGKGKRAITRTFLFTLTLGEKALQLASMRIFLKCSSFPPDFDGKLQYLKKKVVENTGRSLKYGIWGLHAACEPHSAQLYVTSTQHTLKHTLHNPNTDKPPEIITQDTK